MEWQYNGMDVESMTKEQLKEAVYTLGKQNWENMNERHITEKQHFKELCSLSKHKTLNPQ